MVLFAAALRATLATAFFTPTVRVTPFFTAAAGARAPAGLRAGVDVARGPEENAFYIVVGSSWR